jgi:hypothetical protein
VVEDIEEREIEQGEKQHRKCCQSLRFVFVVHRLADIENTVTMPKVA